MVAIFTGSGTGFERGSGSVLGASGLLGGGSLGRAGEQVFLNVATGNLHIRQRDEFLVGRGPDASIARSYNSMGETTGDEADHGGDLWRMGSERRIINVSATISSSGAASGGQVKRISGDGSVITYTWDAAKLAYIATDGAGAFDKLTCSGNVWTWTDGDSQWTEKYEAYSGYWRITEFQDTEIGSLNKLTFSYHAGTDRLNRVTTADGAYVQYEWDGSSRLSQLVTGYTDLTTNQAKTLTRTRYAYDSSNRLERVTVDLSPENGSIADGKTYVTSYAYDGSSNRIASISQSDGSKLAIGYTAFVVGSVTEYRVTSLTQTVSSGVTRATSITYGSDVDGTYTDVTDAANQVTRLRYDSAKQLTKLITPPVNGSAQQVEFAYDSQGNVTSVKDQLGNTTYTHDGNGNIETITDRLGNVTRRTYSATNQLLRETRDGADAGSDSASHTTHYVYDVENHLRFVVTAEGHVTEYRQWPPGEPSYTIEYPNDAYAPAAPLTEILSPTLTELTNWVSGLADRSSARITKSFYDARGNLTSTYRYATANTNGTESTADGFELVTYSYDQAGQLRTRTTQGQGTESFIFDGMGRIVASTDAAGATTRYTFQDAATTTVVTLADGTMQTSTYNKAGELLSSTESAGFTRSANLASDLTSQWTTTGANMTAAGQDASGAPAYLYEVQATGAPGSIRSDHAVAAGETITLELTLKAADATNLLHRFAIGAGSAGWNGELEVTVLSGPGQVAQYWPGWAVWEINGLSTTQETRIRISRTFNTADVAQVYSWVSDSSSPAQQGDKVIFSNPVVTKTKPYRSTQPSPASLAPDLATHWTTTGADRSAAGYDTSGAPAHLYEVTTTGSPGSIRSDHSVAAGETVTLELTLRAADAANILHRFAIGSGVHGWTGGLEVAILSGPGQVAQYWPGWAIWEISGLSTTQETRIRISRTFDSADTAQVYSWVSDSSSPAQQGDKVIFSNPVITKTNQHKYDDLGRLRVSIDASGVKTYFYYDAIGRKIAEIGGDGRTYREFRYDANNRLVATLHSANASPKQGLFLTGGNLNEFAPAAMRPTAHASDIWEWRTYDKEGRLTGTVTGDGSVQAFSYDASGRLIETRGYANKLGSTTVDGYKATAPASLTLPTMSADDTVTRTFYDKDGRLLGVRDGAGYLTRIFYDKAGRKIAEVAYATATGATGTLDAITPPSAGADRHTRYAYDGRGQLRYQIDSLNQVVELIYNAAGQVTQTIAYAAPTGTTSDYSYANVRSLITSGGLAANTANRRSWSVYDTQGRLAYAIDAENAVTQLRYDHAGRPIASVAFDALRTTTSLPTYATMQSWAAGQAAVTANRVSRSFYDVNGDLAYSVNAEGNVTGFAYDAENRLTRTRVYSVQTSLSDASTLADLETAIAAGTYIETRQDYDAAGRLSASYDGENYKTSYVYLGTNQASFVIDGDGTADASTTAYSYDGAGRILTETRGSGTAQAATITYAYDGLGNVTSITDPRGYVTTRVYDRLGQMVGQTNAENGVTAYEYDAFGQVVRITDARLNETVNEYDKLGRLVETVDAENGDTDYYYDVFGQLVRTTDARGYSSFNYYDRLGRLTQSVDAENYITKTSYTSFGEVESVTRYAKRATNVPAVGTPPDIDYDPAKDATTGFEYDKLSRLTKVTDALGKSESYGLDAFGNRTSVTNKLNGTTTYTFDKRGLLLSETLPMSSWSDAEVEVATKVTNSFTYDARGNRKTMVEAFGRTEQRTTSYTYDKLDRLVEQSQLVATGVGASVTATTEFKYDLAGNLIETVDANDARTLFYYDKIGRKTVELSAVGTYSKFVYDPNGNVTQTQVFANTIALPGSAGGTPPAAPSGTSRVTNFTYDALNRLETSFVTNVLVGESNNDRTAWVSGSGPVTLTTTYAYDANGNLVSTTDPEGNVSYHYYDQAGRRTATVDAERYLTTWVLDAEGNVLSETRYATRVASAGPGTIPTKTDDLVNDRITVFTYDKNGNRLSESRLNVAAHSINSSTGELTPLASPNNISTIRYEYNEAGQVTKKTEATGEAVEYAYDDAGRLSQETRAAFFEYGNSVTAIRPVVRYFYDGLNNVVRTVQTSNASGADRRVTRNVYGAGGRLTQTIDAASNARDYLYDAAGNVVAEKWTRTGSATGTEGVQYQRDLLGRVTKQSFHNVNGTTWTEAGDYVHTVFNAFGDVVARGINRESDHQERFVYDAVGRLTGSNSGDGVWRHFGYDGAGRQTLVVESEGGNLTNFEFGTVLSLAGSAIAGSWQDGYAVTVNTFDGRGQMLQSNMLQRETTTIGTGARLYTERAYNAFGEVTSERDTRGNTTLFTHNTMGRTTLITRPTVTVVSHTGATTSEAPQEEMYYDLSGRLVASDDANNNQTRRVLLAGTGYGGTEALVWKEIHADDGVKTYSYNAFGDVRHINDEINRGTEMSYDAMGRVTSITHNNGLVETIGYDELGQLVSRANSLFVSQYGSTLGTQTTAYDITGRVRQQVAYGGDTTNMVTTWDGSLSSGLSALGTPGFGGWEIVTTYANGRTSIEKSDQFGHQLFKKDLGNQEWTMTYDLAGRMTGRSGGRLGLDSMNWSYLNTGLVKSASGNGYIAEYGYDAGGNRTSEYQSRYGTVLQNATASYDALGRMTAWNELGNATTPASSTSFSYDAVGNIRRSVISYYGVKQDGTHFPTPHTTEHWYLFDKMNRVTTDKGLLINGEIVRSSIGADYAYDKAGQRIHMIRSLGMTGMAHVWVPTPREGGGWETEPQLPGGPDGSWQDVPAGYLGDRKETYAYDAGGALLTVHSADTGYVDNGNGNLSSNGVYGTNRLVGSFTNDLAGRVTRQQDYTAAGAIGYDRSVIFNAKGQVTDETAISLRGTVTWKSTTENTYGSGATYGLGAVLTSSVDEYELTSGGYTKRFDADTVNTPDWWGGMVTATSTLTKTGEATATTTYTYGASGSLDSVHIGGGRSRTVTFTNDVNGQAIKRQEVDLLTTGDPSEIWYRYGGKEMGHATNNGLFANNYASSVKDRTYAWGTGPFRDGRATGETEALFDPSVDPITSWQQGGAGGSYEVRGGETLAGIAANLWGDSSLWYKLAEANGLSAGGALVAGQRLTIPSGVMKSSHNASTFKPYDPSEVIGDLAPAPAPQAAGKKNKCGAFGAILLVAIAVAVTVVTQGAIVGALSPLLGSTLGGIVGGAATGALASVVSQGVGVATGIQDKFDWKGVALAAIGGGIGGGIGASGLFDKTGALGKLAGFAKGTVQGAIGNLANQGIALATGLQSRFDWAGLAGAALGGGVASGMGSLGKISTGAYQAITSGASAITNAAARSLIDGTSFGDNVLAALPDVIGSTIGNAIGDAINGRGPIGSGVDAEKAAAAEMALATVVAGDRYASLGETQRSRGAATVIQPNESGAGLAIADNCTQNCLSAIDFRGQPETSAAHTIFHVAAEDAGLEPHSVTDEQNQQLVVRMNSLTWYLRTHHDNRGFWPTVEAWRNATDFPSLYEPGLLETITTGIQWGLTKLSEVLTYLSDGLNSTISSGLDQAERIPVIGPTIATGGEFVNSTLHTVIGGIAAAPHAAAHPVETLKALGNGIDSVFLDDRPVLPRLYNYFSTSSMREIARDSGNIAGNVILTIGPARAAAGPRVAGAAADIPVPGRVASRININIRGRDGDIVRGPGNGSAGWGHVVDTHFNPARTAKSQFTISRDDLAGLLSHRDVVGSPATGITANRFRRTVEIGSPIGRTSANRGGLPTSILTIITDKFGNLMTAYPGR